MAHLNKITATSPSRQHPSELETNISQAIYDLETNSADMKSALRPLQFVSAREVGYLALLVYF
jgi:small subunit ribosomal protein S7e